MSGVVLSPKRSVTFRCSCGTSTEIVAPAGTAMKIDWAAMRPEDVAEALRTIPFVAYAWKKLPDDDWVRVNARPGVEDDPFVVRITLIGRRWSVEPANISGGVHYYLKDAKEACDAWLEEHGWVLVDSSDGSSEEG